MLATNRGFLKIALLFLLCSGCAVPATKNPLVDPSEAKAFPEYHGVYRTENKENSKIHYAHIGSAGDQYPEGFLKFILVVHPSDSKKVLQTGAYIGFVEKIGKEYLLHLPVPENNLLDSQIKTWGQKWDASKVETYLIVKLTLSPETLRMAVLDGEFIEEMVKAKKLAGQITPQKTEKQNGKYVTTSKSITITAGTEELRQFFKKHLDDKLFQKEDYFKMKRIE